MVRSFFTHSLLSVGGAGGHRGELTTQMEADALAESSGNRIKSNAPVRNSRRHGIRRPLSWYSEEIILATLA